MRTLSKLLPIPLAVVLALAPAGCRPRHRSDSDEGGGWKPDPAGAGARNDIQRGAQRQVNQALMENIGLYYRMCCDEQGAPRTLDQFKAYVRTDPNARNVSAALDKGWFVIVLDPPPNAHQILAYEKEAYQPAKNRLALLGDCHAVVLMDEADFQKTLKGR